MSSDDHRNIFIAIRDGASRLAEKAATQHIRRTLKVVEDVKEKPAAAPAFRTA